MFINLIILINLVFGSRKRPSKSQSYDVEPFILLGEQKIASKVKEIVDKEPKEEEKDILFENLSDSDSEEINMKFNLEFFQNKVIDFVEKKCKIKEKSRFMISKNCWQQFMRNLRITRI